MSWCVNGGGKMNKPINVKIENSRNLQQINEFIRDVAKPSNFEYPEDVPFEIKIIPGGKSTYLWFGIGGIGCGTMEGKNLKRFIIRLTGQLKAK